MPQMSRVYRRPRSALRLVAAGLCVIVGCSSPTAPTAPTAPPRPPVVVPPTTPALSMTCPANVTAAATTGAAVAVTFSPPAATGGVAPVQVTCTRQSGSSFAVGTTPVSCTATDAVSTTTSCSFSVTVTAPIPQLARTRFLAFGDSTTAGEVAIAASTPSIDGTRNTRFVLIPTLSYPTQLLSQLRARYTAQAAVLEMINAGLPGEWAEDGAVRLPGVLASRRPEAVLLLQGLNELGALGTPGVQRAWRAIDLMAKEIRGRGARAFLATLPPSRGAGANVIANSLIQSLNSLIQSTARGEGAVLVDLYAALAADVNRYIGADGRHPTEAGYQKIAETFFAAIRADLEIVPR